jgi:hypothetical protein
VTLRQLLAGASAHYKPLPIVRGSNFGRVDPFNLTVTLIVVLDSCTAACWLDILSLSFLFSLHIVSPTGV